MELNHLHVAADAFAERLLKFKALHPEVAWYPYRSLENFATLDKYFKGEGRSAFENLGPGFRIADIGAADGDTSFFLEQLGSTVTIIDQSETNHNDCMGINLLSRHLGSSTELRQLDLDFSSSISGSYDLIMFLGVMYHLRNPLLVLNGLAFCAPRLLLSTLVMSRLPTGENVRDITIAYLPATREVNNDPTNYWIFTPASVRLALKRSGWIIKEEFTVGAVGTSSPGQGDERMFCYCERVPNWKDLRRHHDF